MKIQLDFLAVLAEWPLLLTGVGWTLGLTVSAVLVGTSLGIGCAWVRARGFGSALAPGWLKALVAGMVINLGAYATEIIRAGLEATPKGQMEAAASLALNRVQTFVHVVLPPALKTIWPSLVSQVIIVMLGSSVCGQISTPELSSSADLIHSRNFRSFEAFMVVGLIYLVLCIAMRHSLNWLGAKLVFGGK
jgi:polar amino acid transport system permease protein